MAPEIPDDVKESKRLYDEILARSSVNLTPKGINDTLRLIDEWYALAEKIFKDLDRDTSGIEQKRDGMRRDFTERMPVSERVFTKLIDRLRSSYADALLSRPSFQFVATTLGEMNETPDDLWGLAQNQWGILCEHFLENAGPLITQAREKLHELCFAVFDKTKEYHELEGEIDEWFASTAQLLYPKDYVEKLGARLDHIAFFLKEKLASARKRV